MIDILDDELKGKSLNYIWQLSTERPFFSGTVLLRCRSSGAE
jgi:hypothetical protein